jgi:hypothetical protein
MQQTIAPHVLSTVLKKLNVKVQAMIVTNANIY